MKKPTLSQIFRAEFKRAKHILLCNEEHFNKELPRQPLRDICTALGIPAKTRVRVIDNAKDCFEFRCDGTGYTFALNLVHS